jgi:hypothetical protein
LFDQQFLSVDKLGPVHFGDGVCSRLGLVEGDEGVARLLDHGLDVAELLEPVMQI